MPERQGGKMEFNRQCVKIYYVQSQLRRKCKFNIYRLSRSLWMGSALESSKIVGILRKLR